MRVRLSARFGVALALGIVAACQRTHPPFLVDGAGPPDSGPAPDLDSDADGLCDVTEYQRRTDPFNADTDGDGFSDYVEAQNGTSPTNPTQPDIHIMAIMSEAPQATLDLPMPFRERGIGETFVGQFVRVPIHIVDDGTTAQTFFTGAEATLAVPLANVRGGLSGPRFLGVVGSTLLVSTMHFAQIQPPRGCMRGYPFAYELKADNGAIRGHTDRWLVLMPAGMSIGGTGARWCGPTQVRCL